MQMRSNNYYVYIATNKRNTVLYTGVTSDISRRIYEHKNKLDNNSFTARYNIDKLVYYELFEDVEEAISREKQIKGGSRKKKNILIERANPVWRDLSDELI